MWEFNLELLRRLLKRKINENNLALREAGSVSKTSASTLSRVLSGKLPDFETFLQLCTWLECSPATFFTDTSASSSEEVKTLTRERLIELFQVAEGIDEEVRNSFITLVKLLIKPK